MSDQFTVEVQPTGGSLTLRLAGELDLSTVGTLRSCLDQLDGDVRTVVLDLGALTFLDSSGLNLIAQTHERFGPELRELLLVNPPPAVRRVLQISGISDFIAISDGPFDPSAAGEPAEGRGSR